MSGPWIHRLQYINIGKYQAAIYSCNIAPDSGLRATIINTADFMVHSLAPA